MCDGWPAAFNHHNYILNVDDEIAAFTARIEGNLKELGLDSDAIRRAVGQHRESYSADETIISLRYIWSTMEAICRVIDMRDYAMSGLNVREVANRNDVADEFDQDLDEWKWMFFNNNEEQKEIDMVRLIEYSRPPNVPFNVFIEETKNRKRVAKAVQLMGLKFQGISASMSLFGQRLAMRSSVSLAQA